MKIHLPLLILALVFVGCNSQPADLSPINRTPIKLETTNTGTFTTMMIWATNGSHSFARSYTSAPVIEEEVPKGNYEFYAVTYNGVPEIQKCARATQRLQGKMNFINLEFQQSNCTDPAFLGPDPSLNIATLPAVFPAFSRIELCEDVSQITHVDDKCTDRLDDPMRKSGRGHARSFRMSMMNFEKRPTLETNAAFSTACIPLVTTEDLRGDHSAVFSNAYLPGDGVAPFFVRFEFFPAANNCTGDPVLLDLHRGLDTQNSKSKLVVTAGSPGRKKIAIKLAGPEICQGSRLSEEFAGGTGTINFPRLICNATQLRNIFPRTSSVSVYQEYASKSYKLLADIDLSKEAAIGSGYNPPWASCVLTGSNFMPIGTTWDGTVCSATTVTTNFYFDGGGHEIRGLSIRKTDPRMGLYGSAAPNTGTSTIQRLRLRDSYLRGGTESGTIVGLGNSLILKHITLTKPIVDSANGSIGGVIGKALGVRFEDIKVEGISLTGLNMLGGIAGSTFISGTTNTQHLRNWVSGTIRGQEGVGGIVGRIDSTGVLKNIKESRFTGNIEGTRFLGGLVGIGLTFEIENSYARARFVTNPGPGLASNTGGLVGNIQDFGTGAGIYSSYAIPEVSHSCDLTLSACNIGAIVGSVTAGYDVTKFDTSVYPASFPYVPTAARGVPQADPSFQSYTPNWMNGGVDLMPSFSDSIWLFENGAYPRFLAE